MQDLFDKIYKSKGPLGKWASIAEGYFVFPKLSKFEVDGDRFTSMMEYYKARFDEEFDLAIRELHYDFDSSGTFESTEVVHNERRRLVR